MSLYGLGKLYLKPEFPDYDPAKAVEYLEEAAQKDNAFAKYQLGKLLCQGELVPKDIARGLPLLEELAENGVTFASYIAGKVYLKEEGWQDIKKAILYFRQAAEAGNPFAEYQLEALLVSLSDRLSRTSGKKVYGYLKADVKAIVDEIVAELAADERIRKLYDLWYEQREDVLRTYTDHFPERVPLEQKNAWKPPAGNCFARCPVSGALSW